MLTFFSVFIKRISLLCTFSNKSISFLKKALREAQTLRVRRSPPTDAVRDGCSKAEPKFSPAADPSPGAQDRQHLIN